MLCNKTWTLAWEKPPDGSANTRVRLDFSTGTSTNIKKPFDMGHAQYQIMLLRIREPEIKIRPLLFSSDELTLQTRRKGVSLVFTPRSAMDCKKKAKQVADIGGVLTPADSWG
jgi:hypothetical protein